MVLIDTLFYAALTPLLPYFSEELGISKSGAGVLSGAFGVGVLAGSAPGGYAASRLGVRAAAVLGLGFMSAASLTFGLADAVWELALLRFAAGFGSALSWVSAFAWIVARAPEGRRGELIGTLVSAAVVGAMLGPVLGSAAATVGLLPAFGMVAALGIAVAAWAWLTPAPAPSTPRPLFEVFSVALNPRLAAGLALIGLSPLLFSVLTVLAPLSFSRLGWGAAAIGGVFLVAAVFEAAAHPAFGRWSDRAGSRRPILAGLAGSLALLLALPWAASPLLLAAIVAVAAILFNAPLVPGTAMFSRRAEKAGVEPAIAFGATNFAWAAGYAVGAPLAGVLADLGGDPLSYLSLAAVCLLALLALRWAL